MSKSESYKPAECCCLDASDAEPCWGEVGLDSEHNYCCEGHMGYDYTPEPSAEVVIERLKASLHALVGQYGALGERYEHLKAAVNRAWMEHP